MLSAKRLPLPILTTQIPHGLRWDHVGPSLRGKRTVHRLESEIRGCEKRVFTSCVIKSAGLIFLVFLVYSATISFSIPVWK